MRPTFSSTARLCSFGYTFEGSGFILRTQHNAGIHLVATAAGIFASVRLGLSAADWRWVVTAIRLVWAAEASNAAVEHVCDVVPPERRLAVERAKDVAAGGVLLSAIGAAAIGALTFWPYLVRR